MEATPPPSLSTAEAVVSSSDVESFASVSTGTDLPAPIDGAGDRL
jgi:hypothetical protein